jgi:hypothetical protein
MDDSARGIATAALTLQSDLLRALVRKALLTRAEALDIVDSSLLNAASLRWSRLVGQVGSGFKVYSGC